VATSVSPQGNWTAKTFQGYFEDSEAESSLIRVSSGEQEWIADTPTEKYGLVGIQPPVPLSWSNDERFFFFTYSRGADGCFPPGNGWKVFRLDLATGMVKEVPTDAGYWYVPSSDGLRLAYVFNKGAGLHGIRLLYIETGAEQEIQLDFASLHENIALSNLTWSPNNNGLLVIATVDVCLMSESLGSLLYIDLETLQQITLLEGYGELKRILEWTEPEKALLEFYDGRIMWVNTLTGELTPAEE
jgi:hypothetical protein